METEQSNEVTATQQQPLDSILGTFKDVEALKKSYDNLRSEFTRKSQELSRLNKMLGDKESTPPSVANEQQQTISSQASTTNQASTDKHPEFWEGDSWQQNTVKFFNEFALSDEQKYQLANILVQDKDVAKSASPLHSAYIKLLQTNKTPAQGLVQDPEFLEKYVFNNEDIKSKIIGDYLQALKNRDSVPDVMPQYEANFGERSKPSPKTLSEAKRLASKYFD